MPPRARRTKQEPRLRIRDRSTGDLLVLMIASTVCAVILITVLAVVIVKFFHPETSTDIAVRTVAGILNTMIGLLAGFLAGRTDLYQRRMEDQRALDAQDPIP